jgi:hypothetical protein
MQAVLSDWADEVAAKIGRPNDQILAKGLGASDFSTSRSVEIRYPNGMIVQIPFAFAVFRREEGLAAVFSEHGGYMEFVLPTETVVIENHQSFYYQE